MPPSSPSLSSWQPHCRPRPCRPHSPDAFWTRPARRPQRGGSGEERRHESGHRRRSLIAAVSTRRLFCSRASTRITVEAPGFKKFVRENLVLNIARRYRGPDARGRRCHRAGHGDRRSAAAGDLQGRPRRRDRPRARARAAAERTQSVHAGETGRRRELQRTDHLGAAVRQRRDRQLEHQRRPGVDQ